MKKFLICFIGLILLIIYVSLLVVSFAVTYVGKLLTWLTVGNQQILESIKHSLS